MKATRSFRQKARQLGMTLSQASKAKLMLRRLVISGLSKTSPE